MWSFLARVDEALRGRTYVRIKGQYLNFYLETHATPYNIHATTHIFYFIRLRILPIILVHSTGVWMTLIAHSWVGRIIKKLRMCADEEKALSFLYLRMAPLATFLKKYHIKIGKSLHRLAGWLPGYVSIYIWMKLRSEGSQPASQLAPSTTKQQLSFNTRPPFLF